MNGLKWVELRAYRNWIEQNVSVEEAFGNCSLWVRVMQQAFPELEIIIGSVKHRHCDEAYHEWLKTAEGTIIDPSRKQFDLMFDNDWKYNQGGK